MDALFWFRKIVSPLFFPFPVLLLGLGIGLAFAWFGRRKTPGLLLASACLLVLVVLGYGAVPALLLSPLESRYPPFEASRLERQEANALRWVVVLGGGHVPDPRLPVTSHLSEESTFRLIEAVRIHRLLPQSRLLLCGGAWFASCTEAESMARVAQAMGVDPAKMVLESRSLDTAAQARLIHAAVRSDPFVLVTSASHLPRAMAYFQREGLFPVPAPAGHLVKRRPQEPPRAYFPSAENLSAAERAVYEYLGLLWMTLREHI